MNILGIDYGTKRIGLAWVQSGLNVVLPFGILETKNWKLEIGKLIQAEKIDRVVVGMPYGTNEAENENTARVKNFIAELKTITSIPVEMIDERFSSQAADRMGGEGASRDEKAAMIILQSYLDKK